MSGTRDCVISHRGTEITALLVIMTLHVCHYDFIRKDIVGAKVARFNHINHSFLPFPSSCKRILTIVEYEVQDCD